MKVRLEYGKEGLEADLPEENLVKVLGLQPVEPLADVPAAVREAIQSPIGSAPLRELARGKRKACIVVCDVTRPVPNAEILPVLLEVLDAYEVEATILIATGTHRPNEGDELVRMLGDEIASSRRIVNHVCTDEHVDLGMSPHGIPVSLNRWYVEADLRVTVGMIEPHFMAGYAGGRKMVMPGIAGLPTVQAWHSPRFLEHPNATNGIVEGNPVHEASLAIAQMCPPHFIVDVALDEHKRPYAVFAGDMEAAWNAGVARVSAAVRDTVPEPVDIVVTTCGGYPLDLTFYQSVKGMVGALPILKEGGTIVLASACDEGIGNAHFRDTLFSFERISDFLPAITSPDWKPIADQWQMEELAKACRHAEILMVARGIPPGQLYRLHVTPVRNVEAAIELAIQKHGSQARIAAIPKGPYVLPQVA